MDCRSEGTTLIGDHLTKLLVRITLSASTALTRKIKLSQVHKHVSKFEDITFEGCLKSGVAMATSAIPLLLMVFHMYRLYWIAHPNYSYRWSLLHQFYLAICAHFLFTCDSVQATRYGSGFLWEKHAFCFSCLGDGVHCGDSDEL